MYRINGLSVAFGGNIMTRERRDYAPHFLKYIQGTLEYIVAYLDNIIYTLFQTYKYIEELYALP